jgi:hypothetical protein
MKLGHLISMKSGDEYDAFAARKILKFKPGERAGAKRKYWKRTRQEARGEVLAELDARLNEVIERERFHS